MIICETPRLRIRNWREGDRDLFAEINSDPKVMEFFPFRRSRAESDALFDRNARTIRETGFGFFALALHNNDLPIGFCGLARTDLEPHLPAGTIEIGWRLAVSPLGQGLRNRGSAGTSRPRFRRKKAKRDRLLCGGDKCPLHGSHAAHRHATRPSSRLRSSGRARRHPSASEASRALGSYKEAVAHSEVVELSYFLVADVTRVR